jgi:hypothetical protein
VGGKAALDVGIAEVDTGGEDVSLMDVRMID